RRVLRHGARRGHAPHARRCGAARFPQLVEGLGPLVDGVSRTSVRARARACRDRSNAGGVCARRALAAAKAAEARLVRLLRHGPEEGECHANSRTTHMNRPSDSALIAVTDADLERWADLAEAGKRNLDTTGRISTEQLHAIVKLRMARCTRA